MSIITGYSVTFYGGTSGYQDMRAQIQLEDVSSGAVAVVGFIRFYDPGIAIPKDSLQGTQIIMHMPASMFDSVVNGLKQSKSSSIRLLKGFVVFPFAGGRVVARRSSRGIRL